MKNFVVVLLLSLLINFTAFAKEKEFHTVFEGNVSAFLAEDACNVYEKSSVSIFSVNPGFGKCSGVVVKEDNNYTYVLTAKHCINTNEEIYVEDNKVINIVASVDDDLTILVIKGNIKNKKPVKLSKYTPPRDEIIYFIGYPSLVHSYKSVGKITLYSKDWGFAYLKATGGCSGSGMYEKGGALIGILWGSLRGKDIAVFEPLKDIKKFLKSIGLL